MAVFETTSRIPPGAHDFLRRLRASDRPLDGAAAPDKARAWCKRHDLVTCRKRPLPSSQRRVPRQPVWLYEITTEGRRHLDMVDAQERLELSDA